LTWSSHKAATGGRGGWRGIGESGGDFCGLGAQSATNGRGFLTSGQKKLLELAAQSATFESAIVHQFFDNQNRSTPINDFGRRRITLRAEWLPCQTLHLLLKTRGEEF
jgi:hypothetical protein